ncbi:hypothetical protein TNCV_783231 [Trichonephila clavipes]|nr:hypothetical protein TNCV_783231 [Trichonephila clavipes]
MLEPCADIRLMSQYQYLIGERKAGMCFLISLRTYRRKDRQPYEPATELNATLTKACALSLTPTDATKIHIHNKIVKVYGKEAMNRQHVAKWCHSFQSDRQPQYGRERPTKFFTARIEEMIQNNRWVILSEISSELGLRYGSVQQVISDELRHFKTVL